MPSSSAGRSRVRPYLERVGLAARAVQGGHLGADEPFTGRVLLEERAQVRHDTVVQTHGELGLRSPLRGGQT